MLHSSIYIDKTEEEKVKVSHVMEQHSIPFNNVIGLGDKEEPFIEAGHQIRIKENRWYQGETNFQKKWRNH